MHVKLTKFAALPNTPIPMRRLPKNGNQHFVPVFTDQNRGKYIFAADVSGEQRYWIPHGGDGRFVGREGFSVGICRRPVIVNHYGDVEDIWCDAGVFM